MKFTWVPSVPTGATDLLKQYLYREFTALRRHLQVREIVMPVVTAEPVDPTEGDLVFADDPWDPGSGYGGYRYTAGVWRKL